MGDDNFVESLISEVFLNKCLYDKGAPNFRNKIVKNKLWKEIGSNLGKSGSMCQKRWWSLRERFAREMKKQNEASRNGIVDRVKWEYYDALIFLKDHVVPRTTITNTSFGNPPFEPMEDDFTESGTEEVLIASGESSPSRSRSRIDAINCLHQKLTKKAEELNNETSTINDDFRRMTARLISELPPQAQEETRAKIFQLVSEMRLKYIYN